MRPRVILAAILAALLQTGAIAGMIASRAIRIATGREIVLDAVRPELIPIDQVLLGRNYVHLDYPVSKLDGSIVRFPKRLARHMPFYVTLESRGQAGHEGWIAVAASTVRPATPETERGIVLRGLLRDANPSCVETWEREECYPEDITLRFGIESYFVPRSNPRDVKEAIRKGAVKIIAAVDRNGKAAIKGIIVEGVRHDESLF
jgi:uncharacterized membrane-anchored protein